MSWGQSVEVSEPGQGVPAASLMTVGKEAASSQKLWVGWVGQSPGKRGGVT